MTILAATISHWATQGPDRPALIWNDQIVSYGRMNDLVDRARGLLHERLGDTGGLVGIDSQSLAVSWVWLIAATSLGFDAITVHPKLFSTGAFRAVISDQPLDTEWMEKNPHIDVIGDDIMVTALVNDAPYCSTDLRRAGSFVLVSSGTTGVPKLVPFSEAALIAAHAQRGSIFSYTRDSVVYAWMFPLRTAAGYRVPTSAWMEGACVVINQTDDMLAPFRKQKLTDAIVTPGLLQELVSEPGDVPYVPDLRLLIAGGVVDWALVERARERLTPDLWSAYGSTEAGAVCMTRLEAPEDTRAYTVLPNRELRIVNDEDQPVDIGTPGHLWVNCADDVTSYLGDDAATARFFKDGWFYTGDFVRQRTDGRLEILGRANDVLVLKGGKVASGPFEDRIRAVTDREVCIITAQGETGDGKALLVVEGQAQLEVAQQGRVDAILVELGVPTETIFIETFPRNVMGKVVRPDILRRLAEEAGDGSS